LAGVVWLLDIRRELSADDRAVQNLLAASGCPVLAVLTKIDKLGRVAIRERTAALAGALDLPDEQLQPTSAVTGEGIADLGESILAAASQGTLP
jgi:GTP-binding protein EngB required for normal cell division